MDLGGTGSLANTRQSRSTVKTEYCKQNVTRNNINSHVIRINNNDCSKFLKHLVTRSRNIRAINRAKLPVHPTNIICGYVRRIIYVIYLRTVLYLIVLEFSIISVGSDPRISKTTQLQVATGRLRKQSCELKRSIAEVSFGGNTLKITEKEHDK